MTHSLSAPRVYAPRKAFTLVELSIVLVVIGLLTGGIMAGQSLIRSSELKTIVTDHMKFKQATANFEEKYFQLPGDMTNATSYWGDNATHCADGAIADGTPGTCNGDGDGRVEPNAAAASQEGENFMFWQHLVNAGFLEGNFDGLTGSGGTFNTTSSNSPTAGITNVLWSVSYDTAASIFPASHHRHNFRIGMATSTWNMVPFMTPEELWSIDSKMDDGKPSSGVVITLIATNLPNCATTDVASTAEYALTQTGKTCAAFMGM